MHDSAVSLHWHNHAFRMPIVYSRVTASRVSHVSAISNRLVGIDDMLSKLAQVQAINKIKEQHNVNAMS